jgi:hypothetical protein
MIIIKKLKRPMRKSGEKSVPGKAQRACGFVITNVSAGEGWYVDRVTPKRKKKKKSAK